MKVPGDLNWEELVELVTRIRDLLYLDVAKDDELETLFSKSVVKKLKRKKGAGTFFLNPDKEWECADVLSLVAEELQKRRLVPKKPQVKED